jgi:hypothetical protein
MQVACGVAQPVSDRETVWKGAPVSDPSHRPSLWRRFRSLPRRIQIAGWIGLAWFPELADTRLRQVTWPAIGKHHEYVCEQLKAGVTVSTVHQRLRDERGLAVSVASFRRYVAANVPEETRRSQVKVLRPWPVQPGAEAQIDYGRPRARDLVASEQPRSGGSVRYREDSGCSP